VINAKISKIPGIARVPWYRLRKHEGVTMARWAEQLRQRIAERSARVGIMGLGYVGLPLARAFAEAGFPVLGFDTDSEKVAHLRAGQSYIHHIPAATIQTMQAAGFEATGDLGRLNEPDAILICVPTPLTPIREPDLSFVRNSAHSIAASLRPAQLVVLESTSNPGTTRNVVLPALRAFGLEFGSEVFLAFSPEREDPGRPEHSIAKVPKVVGGFDPISLELACALYECVAGGVVAVSSLEVAETSKLLENTYRAVNIAFVNEMKILLNRLGVDIWEVIEAAKTKPFGFQAFYPGPGLGGPCIPVNPFYLTWMARSLGVPTRLIEAAGEINLSMPAYVVHKTTEALLDRGKTLGGSRILLLGMAYKKDVGDPRESPGFGVMDMLLARGVEIQYHDPFLPRLPPMRRRRRREMASCDLTAELLQAMDCVLVLTDHSIFDWQWIVANSVLVIDTRNATGKLDSGLRRRVVSA
jgi:UDP-N-acetyl-D-glucosamine dehydrogenase